MKTDLSPAAVAHARLCLRSCSSAATAACAMAMSSPVQSPPSARSSSSYQLMLCTLLATSTRESSEGSVCMDLTSAADGVPRCLRMYMNCCSGCSWRHAKVAFPVTSSAKTHPTALWVAEWVSIVSYKYGRTQERKRTNERTTEEIIKITKLKTKP